MQKVALVVDDSRVARLTLKKLLTAQQFEVLEYASAEEVLTYLQSTPTLPDIIFMDVMMEGMDGLAATRQLKAVDKFAGIPIVVCTGNSDQASDKAALESGAVSVLTKPPLQEALNTILSSLPQPEPVAAKAVTDKTDKVDKVVSTIEQKLLPKLSQDCHQLVQKAIEKELPQRLNAEIGGVKASVQQQLTPQLLAQCEQELKTLAGNAVKDAVSQQLPAQLQQAIAEINLTQQVADALASSTSSWLAEQERLLHDKIMAGLKADVEQIVEDFLQHSIAALVAPVVTLQVNEQLAQQSQESELDDLARRVTQLNRTIMGLAAMVFILAALVFI